MSKPVREINFNPEESTFSGVQDLKDLFSDEEPVKEPKDLGDLFEEVSEVEDIRSKEEKQSEDIVETIKGVVPEVDSELEEGDIEQEDILPIENNSPYKDLVKDLFGDTFDSIIIEEDGEEVEKSLEDLDLDKESFIDLVKSHVESVKEEVTKDKLEVKDISDITKKIIEIDKNGGNVTEALKVYQDYQDPFSTLDLTNEEDITKAIIHGERMLGTSDEEIANKLDYYEFKKTTSEEAFKLKDKIDQITAKKVEEIEQNAIKQKEFEKQALKEYRVDLSKSLDDFDLKPAFKKKLLDISSKKGDNGRFELDDLYSKVRANPVDSAELIMFLANKEEYLKQKLAPELTKKQVETQKKLRFTRKSRGDQSLKTSSSKDDLLDMSELPK